MTEYKYVTAKVPKTHMDLLDEEIYSEFSISTDNIVKIQNEPTIGEMYAKIGVDTSGLEEGLDKLEDRLMEIAKMYANSTNLFTINLKPEVTIEPEDKNE